MADSKLDVAGKLRPSSDGDAPAPRKLVVAHFMVGNTYPYTLDDWADDLRIAAGHNLDGFALNVGKEVWQSDRVLDCFAVASHLGLGFKLFLCFDMSSIPATCADDIDSLRCYIERFAMDENYLRVRGKALVSTFCGENSLFGHVDLARAWEHVKWELSKITPIAFVPSFFIEPRKYHELPFLDGAFNWNGCWPIHLTPQSPRSEICCAKLLTDFEHIKHLPGKLFMASVSPWFFAHYGEDSWNKNWIYRGDDWLLVRRWEQLLSMRSQVDVVQLISWNDYGESHYVGPIKGAQPNSEAWVDGFDHTPWLHLNAFFAHAFKTGAFPRITRDRVYAWARPHPCDAVAPSDCVPRPRCWELTDDTFWVVVLARAPATVELRSRPHDPPVECHIDAGYAKLSCPLAEGGSVHVRVVRDGEIVLDCSSSGFVFTSYPQVYNFNAQVEMWPKD